MGAFVCLAPGVRRQVFAEAFSQRPVQGLPSTAQHRAAVRAPRVSLGVTLSVAAYCGGGRLGAFDAVVARPDLHGCGDLRQDARGRGRGAGAALLPSGIAVESTVPARSTTVRTGVDTVREQRVPHRIHPRSPSSSAAVDAATTAGRR
ncbi:hypothetical protein ABZ348_04215 [Streptomyces sp. NPDC005963]|uniref:hypothetical protein n=1 Tax=Streptomyces sp. NPDC005963 TaxID=3156721 RepID=UPI0033F2C571